MSERGIGGTADVFVLVDEEGGVRTTRINHSSGIAELDITPSAATGHSAALRAAATMVFGAPRYQGRPTWVWVEVPIVYHKK